MTSDELREAVARLIDQRAWARHDANTRVYAQHITDAQRREWSRHFVARSLETVDAILSLLNSSQAKEAGSAEGG